MTSNVTKAVRMLSAMHATYQSIKQNPSSMAQKIFYDPNHFPKFLLAISVASGAAGYTYMDYRRQYSENMLLRSVQADQHLTRGSHIDRRFTIGLTPRLRDTRKRALVMATE